MNKKAFWLSLVAVAISFTGGFLLANALNRKEMDNLRAEAGRAKTVSQDTEKEDSDRNLTEDEIRQSIAKADANPASIEFQKGLATALYQYATMKRESKWLPDVARLLNRVHDSNPKDYDALIALGNIYFDLAENNAQNKVTETEANANMEKSRAFFQKALDLKPNEINARTSLGMTYLLGTPPQNDRAIAEFQKTLRANPADEKALESITRAFVNSGKTQEAEESLARLKQSHPNSEAIGELDLLLTQNKNNK